MGLFFLKEDTAVDTKLGPFVDKGDGVAYEVGMSAAMDHADTGVRLSKNGGAFADRAEGTAPAYDAFGYYLVKLDATDTNTPGRLKVIFGDAAVCLPCEANFQILHANVFDSLFGAAAADQLDVNVSQWLGQACHAVSENGVPKVDLDQIGGVVQSATDLKDLVDTGYDPTNHKIQSDLIYIHGSALTETAGQLAAAFIKLFDVATPTLVASSVMRGTDSAATEAKQDIIDTNVDTLIARITAAIATKAEMDTAHALLATPAQVNTQVDAALETAIPASPTANSINQYIQQLKWVLVNQMAIVEASGNVEGKKDDDSTAAYTVAAAFTTAAGITTRKRLES